MQDANKPSEQAIEDYTDQFTTFLSFKNRDLELEFSAHFVTVNLQRWRRSLSSVFGVLSTLYVYTICKNTVDWTTYSNDYRQEYKVGNGTSNLNSLSVQGWYL